MRELGAFVWVLMWWVSMVMYARRSEPRTFWFVLVCVGLVGAAGFVGMSLVGMWK